MNIRHLIVGMALMAHCGMAATWETIAYPANNMRMNERSGFVRDMDDDGNLYAQVFSSAGSTGRTQQVWRVAADIAAGDAAGAWQFAIGGIRANGDGGEAQQSWVKKSARFYSSFYGGAFTEPAVAPQWAWHVFWLTNSAGAITLDNPVNRNRPRHIRVDAWPACGQNLGGMTYWQGTTNLIAIGTARNTAGNGPDIQVRRWQNTTLATLAARETDSVHTDNYTTSVRDAVGNGYFLDCWGPQVWCATNLVGAAANLLNAFPLLPLPGPGLTNAISVSDGRPADLAIIETPRLSGGTICAVSLVTNNYAERGVFLYNVTSNLAGNIVPPLDVTPQDYSMEWRGRLGASGTRLFVNYNPGGDLPGVLRLNLEETDLSAIGVFLTPNFPSVVLFTTNALVPYVTTSVMLQGSNSMAAVGFISWTNQLNGSNGCVAAAVTPDQLWSFNVPLALGANVIAVVGTNYAGVADVRTVTITRDVPAGTGTPVVNVLNGGVQLPFPTSSYDLQGSANAHVMGFITWTNALNGAHGALPANPAWNVIVPLAMGRNKITVKGTNYLNVSASQTADVIEELDVVFELSDVTMPDTLSNNFPATSLGSDGTNLYYSTCTTMAPLYTLPPGGTNAGDWLKIADYPTSYTDAGTTDENSIGDGFWYFNGALYSCIRAYTEPYPVMRTTLRYNIGPGTWETGALVSNLGATAAAVVDNAGNVYYFWKGSSNFEQVTNFYSAGRGFQVGVGVTSHAVDTTRGSQYLYLLKSQSQAGNYGSIYRLPANGSAVGSSVLLYVNTPWQVGMGCAIEFVPAAYGVSGHDELWVLRGAGDGADDAGGNGYTTADVGVYDTVGDFWTTRSLTNFYPNFPTDEYEFITYDVGSDMCRVGDTMYFLRGTLNPTQPASMLVSPIIPEPALLSALALLLCRVRLKGIRF
ncbi:MAG: hypothetical protein NTV22_03185 [bacterium]|nr:hypothetical protein [bacterium]